MQLPEVNGERPQFDFLLAIKQIDSSFSATNINDIENRLLEDRPIPELDHFIQRFRNQYRMEEAAGLKYHRTALATLHGLDEDGKPKPNSNNPNNSNNSKDESRAIQANQLRGKKKCPCNEKQRHEFAECYNCNPSKRPKTWVVKPYIKERINKAMEKDSNLRRTILALGYEFYETSDSKITEAPEKSKNENAKKVSFKEPSDSYCIQRASFSTTKKP